MYHFDVYVLAYFFYVSVALDNILTISRGKHGLNHLMSTLDPPWIKQNKVFRISMEL